MSTGGRPGEYPMRALRELRDAAVDDAAGALRVAESELDDARRAREDAERALELGEMNLRDAPTPGGAMNAADLLHYSAYRDRLRAERDAAKATLKERRTTEQERLQTRDAALSALAEARAEAKAIERHEAKWRAEQARKAMQREEDEADDLRRR